MNEIIIRYKSRTFVSLFIISLAVTVIFAWLYVDRMEHRVRGQIDVLKSVYMGFLAASAILMVKSFSNMTNKKPVMVISEKGICDYTNLDGVLISWENILKAEAVKFGPQKVMAVQVNNADELIANLKKIKRSGASARIKKLGTPVMVSISAHDFDAESTIRFINKHAKAKEV